MSNMDTTRPNISRVYDYMLGGHHNFEVDRVAAQHILKIFPSYPIWARLNRWFLQMVGSQWAEAGFKHIIDLGSGMPTQDHFHTVVSQARVLYTDNDPIAVTYGREVIGDDPRVLYIEHDVSDIPPILAQADRHFGGERHVAIGCIGVGYFFDDQTFTKMMPDFYTWAAPDSILAMSFVSSTMTEEQISRLASPFKNMNIQGYMRTTEQIATLSSPWRMTEAHALSDWLGVEKEIPPDDEFSQAMEMHGALFVR
ncbi:MAG: hypothetical protein HGA65_10460 [Oscillochloris sp.]|nr:hypothetical protein [Oscillochloris sp.]